MQVFGRKVTVHPPYPSSETLYIVMVCLFSYQEVCSWKRSWWNRKEILLRGSNSWKFRISIYRLFTEAWHYRHFRKIKDKGWQLTTFLLAPTQFPFGRPFKQELAKVVVRSLFHPFSYEGPVFNFEQKRDKISRTLENRVRKRGACLGTLPSFCMRKNGSDALPWSKTLSPQTWLQAWCDELGYGNISNLHSRILKRWTCLKSLRTSVAPLVLEKNQSIKKGSWGDRPRHR